MSTYAETRTEAWKRRAALAGEVDFTMMYIAHDAFNRDFTQLTPQTLKVIKISWFKVRPGLIWRIAPRSRRHRASPKCI